MNDTLDQFKNENLFSKNTAEGLKVINPQTQQFYITHKVHKENDLRRPVLSWINCRNPDHHLQPLIKEFPSYFEDANDFVNKINNFKVLENSFLVTMDIKNVYTNILNNESITAVKQKHDNYTKKTVATKVISTFLSLVWTLNNFIFNSKFCLQIKSCAIGTICGPNTQTHLFLSSKRDSPILPLKTNPPAICVLSTIFLWYGPNQKTNLNPS